MGMSRPEGSYGIRLRLPIGNGPDLKSVTPPFPRALATTVLRTVSYAWTRDAATSGPANSDKKVSDVSVDVPPFL